MLGKMSLGYPGARYHEINRGNCRADVFASEGAKTEFFLPMAQSLKIQYLISHKEETDRDAVK